MVEAGGDRVTWTYDATDRLTREQRSGTNAYDTTYTYDPLSNRLVKDASGARTTYAYDLANQLTTSEDANGVTTYTYDLAGNLHLAEAPAGGRTTYTWDDQNRQTGVLLPSGAVTTSTYRFDRLRHAHEDSQGAVKYLWDEQNYLGETDGANQLQAIYTNEPRQYGNLISQWRKTPTIWIPRYHHFDALGSTRALTDATGTITDTYLHDAWGNEVALSGTTVNPFRWVAQVGCYWDRGVGTFHIRTRVYDPLAGRWISRYPLSYPVVSALNGFGSNGTGASGSARYWCICACRYTHTGPGGGGVEWDERYEIDAIDSTEAEKLCSKKCKDISDPMFGGKKCTGILDTGFFYVCDRSAAVCPCVRWWYGGEWLRDQLCRHWDLFHSIEGMIRRGFLGVPHPGEGGKGLPAQGGEYRCRRLAYAGLGRLKWGAVGIRDKKCKDATQTDIMDCIRSKPLPTNSWWSNCQTDVAGAAWGCCLSLGNVPLPTPGNCRCCG
jgi:YD repeat-containing protein